MNIYEKIASVKREFHNTEIKKTGYNEYSNYYYLKLDDFLEPLLKLIDKEDLLSFVSFTHDLATLTVVDTEDNCKHEITSPMSTAKLTACHEVQNLGAVQTYLRRYLYMALFDIAEDDAVDSSNGVAKEEKKVDLSNKDIKELFKMKVGFGKYKELTLGKLFKEDNSYFTWVMNNAKNAEIKAACTIIYENAPKDDLHVDEYMVNPLV